MSDATVTITATPEPEAAPVEAATNEHDVAIAEAEAAAEIAVAEIEAEAQEAAAEILADALEREGDEQTERDLAWYKERVAFLEGQQASPPTILIAEAETPNQSTPLPLEEAETMDPEAIAEADPTISTETFTSGETSETQTEAILESEVAVVVEPPQAARPRKRRMLI